MFTLFFFYSSGLSRHRRSLQWSSVVLRPRLLSSAIFISSPTIICLCLLHPSTLSSVFLLFRCVSYPLSACSMFEWSSFNRPKPLQSSSCHVDKIATKLLLVVCSHYHPSVCLLRKASLLLFLIRKLFTLN